MLPNYGTCDLTSKHQLNYTKSSSAREKDERNETFTILATLPPPLGSLPPSGHGASDKCCKDVLGEAGQISAIHRKCEYSGPDVKQSQGH